MIKENKIINGIKCADILLNKLISKISKHRICLAIILIGNNPASLIYVKRKMQKAREIGIEIKLYKYSETITENEVISLINNLNLDSEVNGILIQLPLPDTLNTTKIINTVASIKDVDGFTYENIGKLVSGQECLLPCTPKGIMMLLKGVIGHDLSGLNAIVIGRSNIVGKPIAHLLLQADCTVTMMHSKSQDIKQYTQKADILIVAVGQPKMITKDYIKPGACVIDVGISKTGDKISGDVDFEDVIEYVSFITPVPGGVGPMTIACMIENTVLAYYRQNCLIYS